VDKNQSEIHSEYLENIKFCLRKYLTDKLSDEWLHDVTLSDFNFFFYDGYIHYLNNLGDVPSFQGIEEFYKFFVQAIRRGRMQENSPIKEG